MCFTFTAAYEATFGKTCMFLTFLTSFASCRFLAPATQSWFRGTLKFAACFFVRLLCYSLNKLLVSRIRWVGLYSGDRRLTAIRHLTIRNTLKASLSIEIFVRSLLCAGYVCSNWICEKKTHKTHEPTDIQCKHFSIFVLITHICSATDLIVFSIRTTSSPYNYKHAPFAHFIRISSYRFCTFHFFLRDFSKCSKVEWDSTNCSPRFSAQVKAEKKSQALQTCIQILKWHILKFG